MSTQTEKIISRKRKILVVLAIIIGVGILYNTVEATGWLDKTVCVDPFNGHLSSNCYQCTKMELSYKVNAQQQVRFSWYLWYNGEIMENWQDDRWYNPGEVRSRKEELINYANEKIHTIKCVAGL